MKKLKLESLFLIVITLVIVVLLNVVAGLLVDRFSLKVDLTKGGVYSLSDETKEVLKNLDSDFKIYYATNAESRSITYSEILERYAQSSDKITYEEVNIDQNPSFSALYKIETYNTVVVENMKTGKKRVMSSNLLEKGAKTAEGQVSSKVTYLESYVTSALIYAMSEDPLTVYITIGKGEVTESSTYLDYLMNMLYREAMTVKVLDITVDAIPSDADLILIAGPRQDYSDFELKKIDDYLEKGGRVQIYLDPQVDLPTLNTYLTNEWKITPQNDAVTDTNEGYVALTADGNYLIPVLRDHDMTRYLRTISSKLRFIDGEVNSFKITENEAIEANLLVTTNATGISLTKEEWAKKMARESYLISDKGELPLVVYLRKNPLNNSETSARLMVSGSYYMLFDGLTTGSEGFSNKDFVAKSITYMSGVEDALPTAVSKDIIREKMEAFEKDDLIYVGSFLMGVIPVALLGYGIYIYLKRKSL